jgi:hypothetical protein
LSLSALFNADNEVIICGAAFPPPVVPVPVVAHPTNSVGQPLLALNELEELDLELNELELTPGAEDLVAQLPGDTPAPVTPSESIFAKPLAVVATNLMVFAPCTKSTVILSVAQLLQAPVSARLIE